MSPRTKQPWQCPFQPWEAPKRERGHRARLTEATTAYLSALEVWTKDSARMDWAMTQENVAIVYEARAAVVGGEQAKADLEQALFHVDAALGVYDPIHSPYDHERATALRERIVSALNRYSG